MSLTSAKPTTTEQMLDIVRHHVDQAAQRALRSMQKRASGVPMPKSKHQWVTDQQVFDALLVLLSDLDPRFGVTEHRLKEEAYVRINSETILADDRAEQARYGRLGRA
jgi:hypothetical protein